MVAPAFVTLAVVLTSCSAGIGLPGARSASLPVPGVGPYSDERPVRVVTTTPLLADIVKNIGAGRVDVRSIVPVGADPHAYEPSLRDIRDIAYADLAVSNYLMLEEHSQITAIDSTIGEHVRHVSVAEGATRYGAQVITLSENSALDTTWLGLRVSGSGANRSEGVHIIPRAMTGPGKLSAYITETFGNPSVYVNSADGFDGDAFELPADAHTHMSWAFTRAGVYTLDLEAHTTGESGEEPRNLGSTRVYFAVGVDPQEAVEQLEDSRLGSDATRTGIDTNAAPNSSKPTSTEPITVLSHEHADITVDIAGGFTMYVDNDDDPGGVKNLAMNRVVVEVPSKALQPVPASPEFRFIERPGTQVYQLPQAVLGSHIHGEIDPHLWMDVRNVKAYAQLLRDELIALDPQGAGAYTRACEEYSHELDGLDAEVGAVIGLIPTPMRKIVTSYDSFAYLAHAYGIPVVGLVAPNPSVEPSVADRSRLVTTLRNLRLPAVFASPTDIRMRTPLVEIAEDVGVKVCPLLSDEFTDEVPTYIDLMRFDAQSLKECLR
ncbi:MAG: zinc ABC transporter substrate-binding protein [Arcanobacterium sp.]|nr:zinc ABC transporter substrate-binding protein [Arcanobacterium sp.]